MTASPVPGWYQDPEGPQGQARYWDGSSWGPSQGGPSGAPAPGTPGPEGPGGARPPWFVYVLVGALVLAVGVWGLSTLGEQDGPVSPAPSTPGPTGPAESTAPGDEDEDPATAEELDCTAAGSENFPAGPEFRVAGIVVPFPHEEWGFRFDRGQWTWVNDLHAWGTVAIEPRDEGWAAGLVAGRLEAANGFGAPEQAADAVVECLVTYGVFNSGEPLEVLSSEPTTVDGMAGWLTVLDQAQGGAHGATRVHVLTLDAGQPGNLAGVVGFYPRDEQATRDVVLDALAGITHA